MDIFPNKSLRLKTDYIDRYIKAAVDSVLESDIFGIFRRPFYTASVFTLKARVRAAHTLPAGLMRAMACYRVPLEINNVNMSVCCLMWIVRD